METAYVDRRVFVAAGLSLGGAVLTTAAAPAASAAEADRRIRVGVIGCGSVSGQYFPHLAKCPHAVVVSACDVIPERAAQRAGEFGVPNHYPHIDAMLAGEPFDLLVNLTDMQEHERLNRQAVEVGKHVWSEKPLANSLAAGREILALAAERQVRVWGAPTVVASPQFAFMAQTIAGGGLGTLAAAHADYGHTGPDWSSFFYEEGGGSLPDLAVYNLTTLTGLLGPARAVTAMLSVVTPKRTIVGRGEIEVVAEDNAMVTLDHGRGVLSHVQSGFNYFNPHGHDGADEGRHTLRIVGTRGMLGLVGYDWEPHGVDLATVERPAFQRFAVDADGYAWQSGASLAAESLATGKELLIHPEHALHVVEIIAAARQSQESGRRVALHSTFRWPLV